jgi:hypothetical protein
LKTFEPTSNESRFEFSELPRERHFAVPYSLFVRLRHILPGTA